MIDYRVFYQKQGNAKFISHLDVNRCMQRAMKRTGLPVWYSQGYNPHIYIAFALPLSLGFSSQYEVMDFRLTEERPAEEICRLLNSALNPDFAVWKVAKPIEDPRNIAWSEYQMVLAGDADLQQIWQDFLTWPEISMTKKTKRSDKLVDLTAMFCDPVLQPLPNGTLLFTLKCAAGVENNLNPTLLTDAFALYHPQTPCQTISIERTGIFTQKGEKFV